MAEGTASSFTQPLSFSLFPHSSTAGGSVFAAIYVFQIRMERQYCQTNNFQGTVIQPQSPRPKWALCKMAALLSSTVTRIRAVQRVCGPDSRSAVLVTGQSGLSQFSSARTGDIDHLYWESQPPAGVRVWGCSKW